MVHPMVWTPLLGNSVVVAQCWMASLGGIPAVNGEWRTLCRCLQCFRLLSLLGNLPRPTASIPLPHPQRIVVNNASKVEGLPHHLIVRPTHSHFPPSLRHGTTNKH